MSDMSAMAAAEISVTASAAKRIAEIIRDEGNPGMMLRIAVNGGGCSGFQYDFTLDDTRSEEDVAIERDGETVILRGTDDGVGVDETDLSRLFERFYRADRARASRGTGLGLAIVKHIALAHGGEVLVESIPGAGSVFTVVIPAAFVRAETPPSG